MSSLSIFTIYNGDYDTKLENINFGVIIRFSDTLIYDGELKLDSRIPYLGEHKDLTVGIFGPEKKISSSKSEHHILRHMPSRSLQQICSMDM